MASGYESLPARELQRVAKFIGEEVGIQLSASKHALVESRLGKRVQQLGYSGFKSYIDHALNSNEGINERLHLIDVLTTNKTDFFRESAHFIYLVEEALPTIIQQHKLDGCGELNVWSAGCSSGEEAYTLAIVLNEAMQKYVDLNYKILATDISSTCLKTARRAIYPERRIDPVPLSLRKKYFLRSKNPAQVLVQMGPELRNRIEFRNLNLMNNKFALSNKMDVIFCRNVMIYFDKETRGKLVNRFQQQLVPGGYFFVGHSESLNGLDISLKPVAPMVYRRPVNGKS